MVPGVGSGRGRGAGADDDMWAARARFWAALEAAGETPGAGEAGEAEEPAADEQDAEEPRGLVVHHSSGR